MLFVGTMLAWHVACESVLLRAGHTRLLGDPGLMVCFFSVIVPVAIAVTQELFPATI